VSSSELAHGVTSLLEIFRLAGKQAHGCDNKNSAKVVPRGGLRPEQSMIVQIVSFANSVSSGAVGSSAPVAVSVAFDLGLLDDGLG
jgi:hypothetical protein